MLFYPQKLPGTRGQFDDPDSVPDTKIDLPFASDFPPDSDDMQIQDSEQQVTSTDEPADSEQPTLGDILHSDRKCTVSIHSVKRQLGGLKEEVAL